MEVTRKALVVDDEPSVRLALKFAMEDEGWAVVVADSGDRALELLALTKPHVIVADKNMPGMDGIELLRRVRNGPAEFSDTAFVLMTGYGNVESAHDAMKLDVDGYVEKPFLDVFETVDLVAESLTRRRARGSLRDARQNFVRAVRLAELESPNHDRSDGAATARIGVKVDDQSVSERLTTHFESAVSSDAVDLWVTDAANLTSVVCAHPGAMVAVVAEASRLSVLVGLLDAGASTVLDPKLGDEDMDRLASLMRRASWSE